MIFLSMDPKVAFYVQHDTRIMTRIITLYMVL
jgi:hypothetical protein